MRDGLLDDGFGVVERRGCEFELGLRRRGSGSGSGSSGGGRPRCSGCWGFWGRLSSRDEWCARRDGSRGTERQWRGMRWCRMLPLLRHRGRRRRRRLHRWHEQMRQSVDEREPPLLRQPREIQALQYPKRPNQRAELCLSTLPIPSICPCKRIAKLLLTPAFRPSALQNSQSRIQLTSTTALSPSSSLAPENSSPSLPTPPPSLVACALESAPHKNRITSQLVPAPSTLVSRIRESFVGSRV